MKFYIESALEYFDNELKENMIYLTLNNLNDCFDYYGNDKFMDFIAKMEKKYSTLDGGGDDESFGFSAIDLDIFCDYEKKSPEDNFKTLKEKSKELMKEFKEFFITENLLDSSEKIQEEYLKVE